MPEDAPDVRVSRTSPLSTPSSVLVRWIAPSTPNGVITSYTLYINFTDGSPIAVRQTASSAVNYTVTGLQPYQEVSVQVSASTSSGEGPLSETLSGRATELGLSIEISISLMHAF